MEFVDEKNLFKGDMLIIDSIQIGEKNLPSNKIREKHFKKKSKIIVNVGKKNHTITIHKVWS